MADINITGPLPFFLFTNFFPKKEELSLKDYHVENLKEWRGSMSNLS